MTTKIFTTASPIAHDGKLYKPGESIELTEAQAEELRSALENTEGLPIPLGKRPAINNPEGVQPAGVAPTAPIVEPPDSKPAAKK